MTPSLERLIQVEPPPLVPVATGSETGWSRVESALGLRLPADYKEYLAVYGAGQWADFFGVLNPFHEWKHSEAEGWREWMRSRLGSLDELRRQFPRDTAPFSPHPAPDGLLPFGYNDNGGTLCWQVKGGPDSGPIRVV